MGARAGADDCAHALDDTEHPDRDAARWRRRAWPLPSSIFDRPYADWIAFALFILAALTD